MSDANRYSERLVLYALLGLSALAWIGFGGLIFVGILQDAGAA